MILHLSNDLMLVGKVSSWAKSNQIAYRNTPSMAKFQEALGSGEVDRVIVDLQTKSLDALAIVELVNETGDQIRLIGYAQHVMTEIIDQARTAGFGEVLTRGQFDRGFASYLG